MNMVSHYRVPLDYTGPDYCDRSFLDVVMAETPESARIASQIVLVAGTIRIVALGFFESMTLYGGLIHALNIFTVYTELAVLGSVMGGVCAVAVGIIDASVVAIRCAFRD